MVMYTERIRRRRQIVKFQIFMLKMKEKAFGQLSSKDRKKLEELRRELAIVY